MDNSEGIVTAVSVSARRGVRKQNVKSAELKAGLGVAGDAHAGPGDRQVSLLSEESIDKMRKRGLDVSPGGFAENITVKGIDLLRLGTGAGLHIGESAFLRISRIGKECRTRCSIYYRVGDCIMPKEGVFAEVVKGGIIRPGDKVAAGD